MIPASSIEVLIMMLHLLLPFAFVASPWLGWALHMPWLTVLLAVCVIPIAEWIWGRIKPGQPETPNHWPDSVLRIFMLLTIFDVVTLPLMSPHMDTATSVWMAVACGYVAGGTGIVLAHELGHRREWIDKALARVLLCCIAYGHYIIEHNRGHHRHAATLQDAASARQTESFWRFMPRYFVGVMVDAVRLSQQKPGRINEAMALLGISLALAVALTVWVGLSALCFMVLTAFVAQTTVASVDYIEHWGLQRHIQNGKPERMGPQHTWDCANRMSDLMFFNLPRHASHHLHPSLDCNGLQHTSASPQMPTGYAGMSLLSLVWPLYRQVMTPRLPKGATMPLPLAQHETQM
jgi:alkane 1-monooxygenase